MRPRSCSRELIIGFVPTCCGCRAEAITWADTFVERTFSTFFRTNFIFNYGAPLRCCQSLARFQVSYCIPVFRQVYMAVRYHTVLPDGLFGAGNVDKCADSRSGN